MQSGVDVVELSIRICDIEEALCSTHYVVEDTDEAILSFILAHVGNLELKAVALSDVVIPADDMQELIRFYQANPLDTPQFVKDFIYTHTRQVIL